MVIQGSCLAEETVRYSVGHRENDEFCLNKAGQSFKFLASLKNLPDTMILRERKREEGERKEKKKGDRGEGMEGRKRTKRKKRRKEGKEDRSG